MNKKRWDLYVYGDVNIDIVIPDVEKFPEPGQENEVPVMETFVGGGGACLHWVWVTGAASRVPGGGGG
ncbi:hypothetical protein [Lacrimispora celerecrescens]|uniref:Carbohydrate kinase PfkB domain-containing protein n=1 Tax=Lacrimispora celerecrescens TaxID=29354 RepID=A0A084JD74_9FIRM|nr:hypothetical protein [Lacrimispora celerecrescens]KEZ86908.1 hypothetical protein IO98_22020 [Lacrimispora celerecrescens]